MYIKEIELTNFKSFGRRLRIPLHEDFIVVTGPNGSGKSNIVDALLFALSLSSSRAMRAERLPDLIYRGDNGKNPNYAQVTVRLDNTSRTMPIDRDVIEISRKIKQNKDKYHSLYYFNGRACSQGELQDHLTRAGITPEGYNVVMQGDVTRIIEMTPFERRKIVDEIAGVAEFDEKKHKALAELDVVGERIGRVDVILKEVGDQLSRLKEERDRALSYQAHRDERRRMEAFLLLAKLREAEQDLRQLEQESLDISSHRESLAGKLEVQRGALRETEESLHGLNSRITHKGEDEQIQVKRKIEEVKGEIARHQGRIEICQGEVSDSEKAQKACYIEIDRLTQEQDILASRLVESQIRKASIQGEMQEHQEEAASARTRIAKADSRFAELRDRLAEVLRQREEAKSRLGDQVRERDRLLDSARRASLEHEEIRSQMVEATAALSGADQEAERVQAEIEDLAKKARELERDKDDLERARMGIRRELAELDRNLQRLQGEYARVEAQVRAAEERSGYSRAVEAVRSAIRRQMLHGLHGTIADLGNVNPRYSTALEIAAGARLQSIVADSDQDAAVAIDYLKSSQIGRATFLPLNKLEGGSLPPLPQRPGVVDYALNLVDFDEVFFPAFWYVFRDTVVVESLDTARQLMGRYRMVTVEGDLVEKSGAMTGGHYRSRLRFAADESKRLVEMSERLSAADGERSGLLERLDRVEEQISRARREQEELDKEQSRRGFRLEESRGARPRLERLLEEKKARLEKMAREAGETRQRLDALEGEVQAVEAALAEHQKAKDRLEPQLAGSRIPELTARAREAEAEVSRYQARMKEIDEEIMRDRLREESLREKLLELARRREELDGKKAEALERARASGEQAAELERVLEGMAHREGEIEAELHELKGERGSILDRMMALQKEIEQGEREMDRLEARLTASTAAEAQVRSTVQELRAEIEGRGVDSTEEPPRSEIILEKIRALEKAMEELEPVNMLAVEEYDRVGQRFGILEERRDTLRREREEIIQKIDRYDQMKKEAFLASFREINQNFKETFQELSGGEGYLVLDNEEDPLGGGMTIKARPAGKVFHRMEAMSGGEKSLTALSFIFAVQRHRPAPFYAMDEIDMFLDGVNAEKVARLIKRISREAQFIVVSLRRPMIQQAKYTVGVAMQEKNVSSVTGICMN
ncbi:MAG: chromosome segregation protein SMC [Methanosarcinales archaeon]|nr:chromosome segregation protein SMC [Methanosarcinales archaeon]